MLAQDASSTADEHGMHSFSSVQAEEGLLQSRPAAMGHREAQACASALAAGDVTSFYDSYSMVRTWEDRWFCLEHVATVGHQPDLPPIDASLIDAWVQGWPDHPVPLLVRAAMSAFQGAGAAEDLARLAVIESGSPVVDGLVVVDRAHTGIGDLEAPLASMLAVEPLYEPHVHFLRSLGPGGGGTIDDVVSFARSVDETVPAGSSLRAMVPLAAIEVILAEKPEDLMACLDQHGLRDGIMMAAGQSVFHPAFVGRPLIADVKAMTAFMVALLLLGEHDLALMLHRRLDGVFSDWPFSLLTPPSMPGWLEIGRHMSQNAAEAAAAGARL